MFKLYFFHQIKIINLLFTFKVLVRADNFKTELLQSHPI